MKLAFPDWLRSMPLIESLRVDLPVPHLNDNTADLDRLARALVQKGFAPIRFHPLKMNGIQKKIRDEDFSFRAVLGYTGYYWEVMDILPARADGPVLGFSTDCGTSSLVFHLIDIGGRKALASKTIANPQLPHGEDILTRILFARTPKNRRTLKDLLINSFALAMKGMLEEEGFSPENVYAVTVAGNTTMSHFFWGLDPANICKEPYIPAANRFPVCHAGEAGLNLSPLALLYLFPNVGSYVGGDLVAGILAAGLHRSVETNLLVDVGTNAEVILGNKEWLIACAGAAGPALEGGVAERGMRASDGAIERVRIDPQTLEPVWSVIGGGPPRGICGSGLIDLVASMFMAGILTIQGKINTKLKSERIVKTPDGPAYVLAKGSQTADGKDLLVSDIDIGIFLKSKAAMYTILTVITAKVGVKFQDIARFYIGGTFGAYIDPESAIRIGMIPDLPAATYRAIGNSSALGASMLLLDRSLFEDIEAICSKVTYIELNVNFELMNEFRGALFLPHTDPRLFPSVTIPEASLGKTHTIGSSRP
jgi:uncharacterized 2Fe-2S/4Fe-4S cluster protein (DUF4445 family)